MALIKCPSCGAEISERAVACPHCGIQLAAKAHEEATNICQECGRALSEDIEACPFCGCPVEKEKTVNGAIPVNAPIVENIPKRSFFQQYKKLILIIVPVFLLVLILAVAWGNHFSENEKLALSAVYNLSNRMKDPDSFKLREDVLVITSNQGNRYVYINHSANNSYGAAVTGIAMCAEDEYICDVDDDTSDLDLEALKKEISCSLIYSEWELTHDGTITAKEPQIKQWEFVIMKKIAKKLHIDYKK